MLAQSADKPPRSDDYLYEVKWDGLRALVSLDEGTVRIHGRNGMDMTSQFPELLIPDEAFRATSALFDGEIVCLEANGKPNFQNAIHRMQQKTPGAIERAQARHPAVCYLFDCLYLDGRAIVNEPLSRRREWLKDAVKTNPAYRLSEAMEDGPAFFAAVQKLRLEGIVAKQRHSAYLPGRRSDAWLKIKTRQTTECIIIGYTRGKGDRAASFGALHLAQAAPATRPGAGDGGLDYVGKVGSGFDERSLKQVAAELEKIEVIKRPIPEKPIDDARSIWLKPTLLCEVQFASRTKEGALREPVFLRLRPDLTV
jgi:DNA ligase D-like protein (predicted ligase)